MITFKYYASVAQVIVLHIFFVALNNYYRNGYKLNTFSTKKLRSAQRMQRYLKKF